MAASFMRGSGKLWEIVGSSTGDNSDDQEPCHRGRSLDRSRGLRPCAEHDNRRSRRHRPRDSRPGDPPADPGRDPGPDGVAFKPDAAPGKQEQGKGSGLSPPHAPHAAQASPQARDLSSGDASVQRKPATGGLPQQPDEIRRALAKPLGRMEGRFDPESERALLWGALRGRLLGEGHTEQSADSQSGDHDPGVVDRLNQRGLFDQRLQHRQGRALERASRCLRKEHD